MNLKYWFTAPLESWRKRIRKFHGEMEQIEREDPWQVCKDGICCPDFTHDVHIIVQGWFENDWEKKNYCEWLAKTLNESAHRARDKGKEHE